MAILLLRLENTLRKAEGKSLPETSEENEDGTLALVKAIEKALQVSNKDRKSIIKGTAKSGTEYLASRSYHCLDIQSNSSLMLHSLISILFILVQFLLLLFLMLEMVGFFLFIFFLLAAILVPSIDISAQWKTWKLLKSCILVIG
ncbi:hypothetical protein ACSBR1_003313 [Camellia fascicularis]